MSQVIRGHDKNLAHHFCLVGLYLGGMAALQSGANSAAWHYLCPMEWDRHHRDRAGWLACL